MPAPSAPSLVQHPQRALLHNEVRARPPEPLAPPLAISHLVMQCDATARDASRACLDALLDQHQRPLPDPRANHVRVELPDFTLRWERHTEFVSWTFIRPFSPQGFGHDRPGSALAGVPANWLAGLPGQCLTGMHLWVLPESRGEAAALVPHVLHGDTLVASQIGMGQARGELYADFALHADHCSHMVMYAGGLRGVVLGRMVQTVLEIETYRMAALLGLPVAREATHALASAEHELATLAEAIRRAEPNDEPQLLDRLTRLAGQVESQYAASHARFSASAAYFDLVGQRIARLGEAPITDESMIGQFLELRLSPARATCAWAVRRQIALSERVARVSDLLRTRVEVQQQGNSQALLAAMNQRADTQLKLQSTVEGLSVAAITYYFVGLISYLAAGAQELGWPLSAKATAALAVPVVAVGVWASIRRIHRRIVGH